MSEQVTGTAMVRRSETSIEEIKDLGTMLAKSGYFQDAKEMSQAVVKILAGREIGISPIASMTGINIIKGKVSLSANIMAAVIKRSGRYTYRVKELTDTSCTLNFYENGELVGPSTFSIADGKRAETQNLHKFPRNMLFARALSNGAKWYCPDLFGGPTYTPEELGATVDERGEAVDVTPTPKATYSEPLSKAEAAAREAEAKTEPPPPAVIDAETETPAEPVNDDEALAAEAREREQAEAAAAQAPPAPPAEKKATPKANGKPRTDRERLWALLQEQHGGPVGANKALRETTGKLGGLPGLTDSEVTELLGKVEA